MERQEFYILTQVSPLTCYLPGFHFMEKKGGEVEQSCIILSDGAKNLQAFLKLCYLPVSQSLLGIFHGALLPRWWQKCQHLIFVAEMKDLFSSLFRGGGWSCIIPMMGPIFTWPSSLCGCVSVSKPPISLLHNDHTHRVRAHPNPGWPQFTLITYTKTRLSNTITFTGTRSGLAHFFLWYRACPLHRDAVTVTAAHNREISSPTCQG